MSAADLNRDGPKWQGERAAINLAVIYEDQPTHEWARAACKLVNDLAGMDYLCSRSWSVAQLNDPVVFPKAARTAALADVIILALHAGAELPFPLHDWFDAWLPQRNLPVGALVSLMNVGESKAVLPGVRGYLEAVACKGRLDLLIEEQKLSSVLFIGAAIEERLKVAPDAFPTWMSEASDRWNHWGINE